MTGKAVTRQSPVLLTLKGNQAQAMGDEDAAEKVLLEDAVNKYMVNKADASTN